MNGPMLQTPGDAYVQELQNSLLRLQGVDPAIIADMPGICFPPGLVAGHFLERLNRFAALVDVDGTTERVHVRNSGRLRELLRPGRRVLLAPAAGPGRATRFTLALVRLPCGYVSADAQLPNALVAETLSRNGVPGLEGYRVLQREPVIGRHRADFLLARGGSRCLLEVKSVTLVEHGTALFPDAPTARGCAHVEHLIAARRSGLEAVILFVIQRSDATVLAPNAAVDPQFCRALCLAVRDGVAALAVTCRATPAGIRLLQRVPVALPGGAARRLLAP